MNAFHSPILRLTLWYVLIIMVISVMFSAIIYQLTATQIRSTLPPQAVFYREFGSRYAVPLDVRVGEFIEERYDRAIDRLRGWLVVLNLVVLGGASVASYALAKRTLRPIEEALDEQRRFTADASHELRTPLAAMQTETEVALKQGDPSEYERTLRSNLEEVGRLERLSSSLLTLARNDDRGEAPAPQPLELADVVGEAAGRVEAKAKRKGVIIELVNVRGSVSGDRARLTELFVILLDNAVKYSPDGTAVKVRCLRQKQSQTIRVIDEGVGIPAEDLPRVFDRFYRADASRSKEKTDGYGLGLSIAKQIVAQHQGTISIASTEGKGTTVVVTLPRE